jgi:hypothetical protein
MFLHPTPRLTSFCDRISWYNDPYHHPLPYECKIPSAIRHRAERIADLAKRCILRQRPPIRCSCILAQYTPLQFAAAANISSAWPFAQTSDIGQLGGTRGFENISPMAGVVQDGNVGQSKKRRFYGPCLTLTGDKRPRQVATHATSQPPFDASHEASYAPSYTGEQPVPRIYDPSVGTYTSPYHQNTSPTAPPPNVPSGGPYLPGAALYEQRYRGQKIGNARPAIPLRAPERGARDHPTTPQQMRQPQDQARLGHMSHVYPTPPSRSPELCKPPAGSQYNPVDLASSPEPEVRVASQPKPKTKTNKAGKRKFYAVAAGHEPGVYLTWPDAEKQTKGYPNAKHQSFVTEAAALKWFEENQVVPKPQRGSGSGSARDLNRDVPYPQLCDPAQASPPVQHSETARPSSQSKTAAPIKTSAPADPEPVLTLEQQRVVDLILAGKNVFYTGSAGCGEFPAHVRIPETH